MKKFHKPMLCLDFDGVLHSYSTPWIGHCDIPDPPVDGAMAFLQRVAGDFEVAIYSARSHYEGGIEAMRAWVEHWLEIEFGPVVAA